MKFPHGGNLNEAEKRFGIKAEDFLDFSSNINPIKPDVRITKVIKESIRDIVNYPDPQYSDTINRVSECYSIPKECIMLGNGGSELIYLSSRVFIDNNSNRSTLKYPKGIIFTPAFSEYQGAIEAAGGGIIKIPLTKDRFDLPAISLIEESLDGISHIYVCSPNNPTGNLIPWDKIMELVKLCHEKNIIVVIDLSFIFFVLESNIKKLLQDLIEYKNVIAILSLTKIYSIPGLRSGLSIGDKDLINRMKSLQPTWSVNIFAQKIIDIMLYDKEHINKTRELITKEREFLYKGFKNLDLMPYPSDGNFILVNISKWMIDDEKLFNLLGERGILVRRCNNFDGLGNHHIRVTIKNRIDNIRLLEELANLNKQINFK